MTYKLNAYDLQTKTEALVQFHREFAHYFQTKTRNVATHALDYLKGQLLCNSRRNISRMAKEVAEKNQQALAHFTFQSPWQDEPLIEAIGRGVVEALSGKDGTQPCGALILDESGIPKQGDKSVGVARQYCGSLGKVDNSQVGVFIAYSTPTQASLIDRRLYLPKVWANDPERCQKAGIPEQERRFRTKAELGLEMILNAKKRGTLFDFVGMDAHYGEQPWLLTEFDNAEGQIVYMADVLCNTRVYLEYPQVGVPQRKGTRGKVPTKLRVLQGEEVQVRDLLSSEHLKLRPITIRDTQRGGVVGTGSSAKSLAHRRGSARCKACLAGCSTRDRWFGYQVLLFQYPRLHCF